MNQGNNRGGGSDDRSDDRYGSQDSGYGTERGERDERRTRSMGQRQQEADSGGWLAHRQQGGGDWPARGGSAQPGAGRDWQGSGQQPGGGSRGTTSISGSSGYGGYEGEARRAGSEPGGQYDNGQYDNEYGRNDSGSNEHGEYGQGRGGQRGAQQPDRERWGQWHQDAERDDRTGRGSEWSSQRGSQRDEWGQGQGSEWQRERATWDPRARTVSGAYPRQGGQGGWERGRGDAPSDFRGGAQGHARRDAWNDPSRSSPGSSPDMRTHYRGGYGVSDYEPPAGESYRGRQRSAAADWLDERERRERWASGAAGYGGYGRSGGAGPGGYDPDERAYEHFTGASERTGLNRGYGGAGGSAAARRMQHVGPKGYQRSDERIREDLCERLAMSSRIDVREVEVTVSGGVVTLSGTVRDRQQKYRIEDIADEVYGVKDVHNQIRLAREAGAGASGDAGRTGALGLPRTGGTLGGLGGSGGTSGSGGLGGSGTSAGTSSAAGSSGDPSSSSGSSVLGGKTST